MKKKIGYELIPVLINKVNKYSDKLKDRVKIDGIFNEIDLYASDGFKKFIKISDNRYRCIKSGLDLNDFLERQKKEYKELSDNILENDFYMNNEIENESKKLYKKVGLKESKELFKIRRDIISENKSLNPNELIKKKKNKNKRTKNIIQEEEVANEENKIKSNYSYVIKNENSLKNIFNEKKKYLSEIVEKDKNFLNKNIEIYKNFLKDIEKTKDNSKILKIMSRNDNLGHKYNFKINNIKLLSFKEEKKKDEVIQKKKEEDSRIDIKKMLKYTKRGNQKWFKEQLTQKSLKRLGPIIKNLKRSEDSMNANLKRILNHKYSISNNDFNKNNDLLTKTYFSNFNNTIKTVKNEAKFIKNIRENFDIKRKTVNKFFKNNSLPSLFDYDKSNFVPKNEKPLSPDKQKDEHITLMFDLKRDKKNDIIENNKKLKDIYDIFKNTYYSKIQSWSLEKNDYKEIKEKEKEINEKNRKYLYEINRVKRRPHLFVDIYSLRDGFANERIKLFNRSLIGPEYSRNNMIDKIKEFTNFIESKEKERIINEEILRKKQEEEELKLKQEDIEYQVWEKMRKNLNLDNNLKKSEENINFNYRYTFNPKNKNKINISEQAFRDYLESLQVVKDKKVNEINNNEDV